nr:NAD(P)/FAD-dependent oxidoreductase [Polymorphobacter sp.]
MGTSDHFDVIVVGGGPSGSAMAWSLARRGVRIAVVERATFPREKVCGDFVEPAGLRILEAMGCTAALGLESRLPITRNRVYCGPRLVYADEIPYYEGEHGMPPHGYIVPRDQLDTVLLDRAEAVSATIFRGTTVKDVARENGIVSVTVKDSKRSFTLTSRLIIGADGVQSVVARGAGLKRTDRRHIAVSQRAYVEGIEIDGGEAAVWFDEDQYPGYGWMFPMSGGRANVGVGLVSETCERFDLSPQQAFRDSIARLRIRHPGCANARVVSKVLGGAVHMYGGIDRNHFDGGLLVGDAGSFVDPMTGEGITQGMESSLIASRTIMEALDLGRFEAMDLARYDHDFRAYFDPAMLYLCFCSTLLRNRHFAEYAMRAATRGFEKAQEDSDFGRVSGTGFGGLNVRPQAIAKQIWTSVLAHLVEGGTKMLAELVTGRGFRQSGLAGDFAAWQRGWSASMKDDPSWHFSWLADVAKATARLAPTLTTAENPRLRGPLAAELETA